MCVCACMYVSLSLSVCTTVFVGIKSFEANLFISRSDNSTQSIGAIWITQLRHFRRSGPSIWNSLTLTVHDMSLTFTGFCSRLKTELYKQARWTHSTLAIGLYKRGRTQTQSFIHSFIHKINEHAFF